MAAEHASKGAFVEVWVSPMRRCIETAFHMFKGHPKINGMRFVVHPLCRERICISSDICVFNSAAMIKHEYVAMFAVIGAVLDLSLIDEACKDTAEKEE